MAQNETTTTATHATPAGGTSSTSSAAPRPSTGSTPAGAAGQSTSKPGTDLTPVGEQGHGTTTIADVVVSKIAGIATREVPGVHALGGGAARVVGQLRERIPGGKTNLSQGVSVEVGQRQAAVDIDIVAEYGVAISDLAEGIRENVIGAVEQMTGLEVTEVNITVHDVYLEDDTDDNDDSDEPARSSRVQ